MQPNEEQDETLMARAAEGRRECLEILVRRYADSLLTFIVRMVGHYHRGEELFQEVFLAVWRKRNLYQFPRSFKAWLFTIAVNKCRAHFRTKSATVLSFITGEPKTEAGETPSGEMMADETASMVKAAVAELPKQQQLVVVLRVWNGLSYAEIAESLGRTEATVRSNMHHALAAMRRYLEPRLK